MEEKTSKQKSELISDIKDIIFAIVTMIVGLLFCIFKGSFLDVIEIIFTIFLFGYGSICLLGFFSNDDNRQIMVMVEAVIYITLGVLIIVVPSFFLLSIGIMLLVYGVRYVIASVKIKKISRVWGLILAYAIVALVLSLVIMITWILKLSQNVALILVGVTLIVEGAMSIALTIYLDVSSKKENS